MPYNHDSGDNKKLIYLASPYTHKLAKIKEERFQKVCEFAASLMREGHHVFSPIAHTHPIASYGLPTTWDYWDSYDRNIMSRCDELAVLCLPGWKESVGVSAEIKFAKSIDIKISYHQCEPVAATMEAV